MKINWGTSIVLAFVAFIVFILFFVVKTFTQPAYEYDLVSEEYYQDELEFQQTINNSENASVLGENVIFDKKNNQFVITIPNKKKDVINGFIKFYRPSNEKLDFSEILNSEENTIVFTDKQLVKGRWNVMVTWSYQGNPSEVFYKKESFYF
ncbi:nitrogen fixation protein FixH [Wenyingzhuangia heitensis]|uniref:Nitrogen fixation protein FixH n=1 Tax=Wenyingzhuangia heitensis TaxID=1487859 RepID=A0ABX0UDD8_9FLAO|nr:FixH family protein [Wenyingzhuangia heitensis]NIJ45181.1 nitrogen fixation protein FixH [Wenyingzhuangia heitensis]